jgi:hypothetical protein
MKKIIKIEWLDFIKLRKVYSVPEILELISKINNQ